MSVLFPEVADIWLDIEFMKNAAKGMEIVCGYGLQIRAIGEIVCGYELEARTSGGDKRLL